MRAFLFLITALVFLTSCSGGFHFEKRRYRNGFYFGTNGKKEVAEVNPPAAEEDINRDWVLSETENYYEYREAVDTAAAEPKAEIDELPDSATVLTASAETTPTDTIQNKPAKKKFLRYDGPPEARWATILHWIGWPLLILGVLLLVLAFIGWPAFGPFFGPLLYIATGVLYAGGIMELIVLIKSIFAGKKYRDKPEVAAQFKKLEKQVTNTLLVIAALYVLFVVLVFVALF